MSYLRPSRDVDFVRPVIAGFVEDQELGIGQHRPGDREQLHLALGNIRDFLVDDHVIAVRQGVDEVVHMGSLGGSHDFFVAGVGPAVADVLHDRPIVEPGVLEDHAKLLAQIVAGHVANVDSIYQDGAFVHIVETHQ